MFIILLTVVLSIHGAIALYSRSASSARSANPPVKPVAVAKVVKKWSWNGYEHVVFEVDGHQYLEARYRGVHDNGAVSVIHYESCPCGVGNKKKQVKTSKNK